MYSCPNLDGCQLKLSIGRGGVCLVLTDSELLQSWIIKWFDKKAVICRVSFPTVRCSIPTNKKLALRKSVVWKWELPLLITACEVSFCSFTCSWLLFQPSWKWKFEDSSCGRHVTLIFSCHVFVKLFLICKFFQKYYK